MEKIHAHSIVRWSLIIGIVIALNMFFNYALSLAYPQPVYPTSPQVVGAWYTKDDCIGVGGQWTYTQPVPGSTDPQLKNGGYCDPEYTQRIAYEARLKEYNRTIFIVLTVLGIMTLILGSFVGHHIVSSALSWGGVLSLIIASMRYWSDANNLIKVCILAVALFALIWIAIKKFEK